MRKSTQGEYSINYFLADPEQNVVKIVDLLDEVAPENLFPS